MSIDNTLQSYQPILQRIAQNILGSVVEAEDVVQDTLLRWLTIDKTTINNTKVYLIKSVKNNCITHIQSIQKKRKKCLDSISVSDIIDKHHEKEFFKFDFDNELKAAIQVIHKKLGPLEKKIYILKEFFDVEYEELQVLFNKKKENCRQLFCRAKSKLNKKTTNVTHTSSNNLFDAFKNACLQNDPASLIYHFQENKKEK